MTPLSSEISPWKGVLILPPLLFFMHWRGYLTKIGRDDNSSRESWEMSCLCKLWTYRHVENGNNEIGCFFGSKYPRRKKKWISLKIVFMSCYQRVWGLCFYFLVIFNIPGKNRNAARWRTTWKPREAALTAVRPVLRAFEEENKWVIDSF